jgi:hypothetical protein
MIKLQSLPSTSSPELQVVQLSSNALPACDIPNAESDSDGDNSSMKEAVVSLQ